jgi:hypothetical protein
MKFPTHFWRYFAILWITVLVVLGAAIWLDNHRDIFETQAPAQANLAPEKIWVDNGHELLRLGNCMACHTERGQAAGAGGRAFQTPFGKVYSSNITPDVQQGLGAWDANDFLARIAPRKIQRWPITHARVSLSAHHTHIA